MPESLQIQGNSGKAPNSCNKQTNATTTKNNSRILKTNLIFAEEKKNWKCIEHYYVV